MPFSLQQRILENTNRKTSIPSSRDVIFVRDWYVNAMRHDFFSTACQNDALLSTQKKLLRQQQSAVNEGKAKRKNRIKLKIVRVNSYPFLFINSKCIFHNLFMRLPFCDCNAHNASASLPRTSWTRHRRQCDSAESGAWNCFERNHKMR